MLKKHESEDMIKTEAWKTWSDHVSFYPPKQVFLDFSSAKTHELPGGFMANHLQCGLCLHFIPI